MGESRIAGAGRGLLATYRNGSGCMATTSDKRFGLGKLWQRMKLKGIRKSELAYALYVARRSGAVAASAQAAGRGLELSKIPVNLYGSPEG